MSNNHNGALIRLKRFFQLFWSILCLTCSILLKIIFGLGITISPVILVYWDIYAFIGWLMLIDSLMLFDIYA